jgi:hypothetical protein
VNNSAEIGSRPTRDAFEQARDVRVVHRPGANRQSLSYDAQMLDISAGGTRLRVPQGIATGERIRIELPLPELGLHLHLQAQVRWQQAQDDGTWLVGCFVEPSVPLHVLDRISPDYQGKQRKTTREPVAIYGTAVWQVGDNPLRAKLQNISEGGISIFIEETSDYGDEIHLCIDDQDRGHRTIHTEVIWGLRMAGGCLVGCRYVDQTDYQFLRAFVT